MLLNHAIWLLPAVAFLSATRAASAPSSSLMSDNPLLQESSLPYQYPPFDRIADGHFAPAFALGMAEHLREVEAIASNPAAPTFENTVVALERAGRLLGRVQRAFSTLTGAQTNDALRAIEKAVSPRLAAHADAIRLNSPLFARIEALHDRREQLGLDPESKRLLERYRKDFVRAGAKLSAADQTRLRAINQSLATLQTTFAQNVQKETNAASVLVDQREQLAGLSPNEIAAAAAAAKSEKKDGKFVLRLLNTSGQPALGTLENRALRERLHQASVSRNQRGGEFDNRAVIAQIVRLRAERAVLLGYPNHAARVLEEQTAGTVGAVDRLLADLTGAAVANARREAADMQAIIDVEMGGFRLAAWDWAYYVERVRLARYELDEAELRPYLEFNRVLRDGLFYAATRLYGITFQERLDFPLYEPTVRVFEVFNADGSPLALFALDLYARPSKRGGAWASAYVSQSRLLGNKPVIANHLNVPRPPEGEPTLLTFTEVKTLFHEFGHALHGMFSDVMYPRFAGTSVPRDFVEFPSQVNEMWFTWPEVLANYAKHYETGEPMPLQLLERLIASGAHNQGFKTTEYLAASLLDQAWHQITPEQVPGEEGVVAFEQAALRRAGVDFAPVPPRYRSGYFTHTFSGGYSAGYYSYIWAEVLDADSVEWFKRNGGLTRKNGDHFRRTLLSRGGSDEALNLFRAFAGQEPDVKPLLERRGLTATAGVSGP
jgi:peptidyl-dipeptidase Dcp